MIYTLYLENPALLASAELILGEKPDVVEGGGPEAGHRRLLHLTVQRLLLPTTFPALCKYSRRQVKGEEQLSSFQIFCNNNILSYLFFNQPGSQLTLDE
jgi:hypothetical protein